MRIVLNTKQKLKLNILFCLLNSPIHLAGSTVSKDKITVLNFSDKHTVMPNEVTSVSSAVAWNGFNNRTKIPEDEEKTILMNLEEHPAGK